jgi:hypothetical protein
MSVMDAVNQKYGPLTAWQWGLAAAGIGYFFLRRSKKAAPSGDQSAATSGTSSTGTPGEFSSSQQSTKTDPNTGETISSSYNANGPLGSFGAGVGIPQAYPMPYSGGDVYVNLPGDTQNMNSGRPATFPPVKGTGVSAGHVGGFWWTPLNRKDVYNISATPYGDDITKLSPAEQAAARIGMNYARILDANPQIDWASIRDINDVIGKPIYIPRGSTGDDTTVGYMPPNASLNAPQGYTPPTQQTAVSGTV